MRKYQCLLVGLCFLTSLTAQQDVQLPGVVVEQNSKFLTGTVNYLANAQIKSAGANPQRSDAQGRFTLIYADQPFGNVARIYATKQGYELVNDEELKKAAVMGRNTPLKVVMCKVGTLYENQIAYYAIVEEVTRTSYETQLAQLEQEGRDLEVALAEMQVQFNQEITSVNQAKELLLQQLHSAQQQAKELADKFVTVNLDDQSETYQRAFRAFMQKDIDQALLILDSVDLALRLATNAAAMAKENELMDTLAARVAKRSEQMAQDVEQCVFKARLHILKYEFKEAEEMYELALQYQKDDESLIFDFALFLQEQNRFKKANNYYEEALSLYRSLSQKNPEVYLPDVAGTLNNMGILSSANNEIELAEKQFAEALLLYRGLSDRNSEVYLPDVSSTLHNLANLSRINNDLELAEKQYAEALTIRRALSQKNPEVYLPDVAGTLNNLGILSSTNNEIELAKIQFAEALLHYRSLAEKNPEVHLPNVAGTLTNLGNLSRLNDEPELAKKQYAEALSIRRALAQKNPDAYLPDVASTLNNLGNLTSDNNELELAKKQYMEALAIRRTLANKNPEVYLPDIASTLNNLGLLSSDSHEPELAKKQYVEALTIRRALAEKNPDAYLPDVAETLNNMGNLSRLNNDLGLAKKQYTEALTIRQSIAQKSPRGHNLEVSRIAINLGIVYEDLLKSTGDIQLKHLGLELMQDAQERLAVYSTEHPGVELHQNMIDRLTEFFTSFTEEDFLLYKKLTTIDSLKEKNAAENDFQQRVLRQEEVTKLFQQIAETLPTDKELTNLIAQEHGSLAWYQLFNRQFTEAENSARQGLRLDPSEEWINTNLALALLYQGKLEDAKAIYLQFKDQTYGEATYQEVFLEDLNALENEGITHPEVATIRALLNSE